MRVGDQTDYGQVERGVMLRGAVGGVTRLDANSDDYSSHARVNIIYVIIFMVYIIEEWLRIQNYYYNNYIKSQM